MKKKQVYNLKNKACSIAKKYLTDESVHGMPHINRMRKKFKLLKDSNKSISKDGKEILDAVEFAVILHDIGRKTEKEKGKRHEGVNSIKILKKNENDFFLKIPNYDWVGCAIIGHTDRKEIEKCKTPNTSKKICLALLLTLDNMDAIGKIGVCRDIKDMKDRKILKNWIPPKCFKIIKDNIEDYFEYKREVEDDKKDNSLLERLLVNYRHIKGNLSRIKNMKSKINKKILLDLYERLEREQKEYILELIKEKKLKITDSEIKRVLTSLNFCK